MLFHRVDHCMCLRHLKPLVLEKKASLIELLYLGATLVLKVGGGIRHGWLLSALAIEPLLKQLMQSLTGLQKLQKSSWLVTITQTF